MTSVKTWETTPKPFSVKVSDEMTVKGFSFFTNDGVNEESGEVCLRLRFENSKLPGGVDLNVEAPKNLMDNDAKRETYVEQILKEFWTTNKG